MATVLSYSLSQSHLTQMTTSPPGKGDTFMCGSMFGGPKYEPLRILFLNFPQELSHHLSGSLSESPFRMQWKVRFFPTSATRLAAEIAKLLPGSIPLEQTPRYTFSTGSPA